MTHPDSPRLDHCPPGLPQEAYLAQGWFDREMASVFARRWVNVGRLDDFSPGTARSVTVGRAPVIVLRDAEGAVAAFHNSCRHRGSELCAAGQVRQIGRLLTCPYHAWAYEAATGRLVSTAHARPTKDFRKEDHALLPVQSRIWAGFLFLNLSSAPLPLTADVRLDTLDNWSMDSLRTGHRWETVIACNWKAFWENYSECLHCPGIHPELCDMVPVYGSGLMAANEALDWRPDDPRPATLKPGAETWTMTGAPCGPAFPSLTAQEQAAGYTFITLWPSTYVVAHVDYVRCVRLEPLTPTTTRLIAEWYFSAETLAQPGFDAAEIAAFAKLVMEQDSAASEMNQRGIASPGYQTGRLMPEEYEIHRFHRWLLKEMEAAP